MQKKVTIHDIAEHLQTTAATVSRALNDHPAISERTKKKVREAAQQLGYERNQLASALRKGSSQTVGVIVPLADRNFFSSVVSGLQSVLNEQGYNVIICQSNDQLEKEIQNIDTLLNAQVDAIVISISKESIGKNTHLHKVVEQGTPLLMFDRIDSTVKADRVCINDIEGGRLATAHLLQQKDVPIACLHSSLSLNIYKDRFKGYQLALEEKEKAFIPEYCLQVESSIEAGYQGMKQLLERLSPPFGLFCTSDYTAIGAMEYLKELKYTIPEDVHIVGYSNEPLTAYLCPPLSTIDQKSKQLGMQIGAQLLQRFKTLTTPPKIIDLLPELLTRTSSLS
ncbi:LacI family DNA-binding transcriptional regulator [Algivirga pacifica]|uniref:LacI family DNA-binding transcriptional regulator n=1 Tax=Algivirga pacifica TaxID=1162670 RepID=A0ABP9DJ67_9BACT